MCDSVRLLYLLYLLTYLRGVVVQVAPQQPHRLEQGEG